MALRLRRGLNADRLNMIPEEGEIIYVTDYDVADVSPLWVGDGTTTGGVAAGATTLDELQDVQIAGVGGVNLADGQTLVYDGTIWRNTREFSVNDPARVIKHTIEATSADLATQTRSALFLSKKITDITTTAIGDNGGPALTFVAETANAASGQAFAQIAALYNDTSNKHDVTILTSDDNFANASRIYLASADRTNINDGVLYVDKLTGRVGINDTSPEYSLDVTGTVRGTGAARFDSTVYVASDLTVNNGVILTNSATPEIMLSATGISVGSNSNATITLRPGTLVGANATQNVYNTVASTVNAFGFANNINMGAAGSTTNLAGNLRVNGNELKSSTGATAVTLSGNAVQVAGALTVNGNQIKSSSTNTALTLNGTDVTVGGTLKVSGDIIKSSTDATAITLDGNNVIVGGNLTVNGTTTTINSTTLTVDDKNIELANGNTTDAGAAGGGITIKGATDKTLTYVNESGFGHFATNIGFRADGRLETTTGQGMLIGPSGASSTWTTGANQALRVFGTTGDMQIANNVSVFGDTIKLNAGRTTGQNAVISVERGAVDSTIQWNQSADAWIISNNMVTDGYIGTNGYDFHFNNDDATIGGSDMVNLNIKRGASTNDVRIRWNENLGRWQSTTTKSGTSAYISLPNQELDLTSNVTFNSATINGGAGITGGLTVAGTTTLNDNVALGSSSGDTLTVNAAVAANTDITFANNGLDVVRGIKGTVGATDYWQFGGGSTATDTGYAAIVSGDNGNEPIYVRQMTGSTVTNEIQLLDSTGITQLGVVNASLVTAARLGLKQGTTTLAIKDVIETTTASTNNTNLLSFDKTLYRSAKVTVQITSGSNYNLIDIMYIHNGTDAYITVGNEIIIGSSLATFTAIPGAIQFTSNQTTSTRYVADCTLISV